MATALGVTEDGSGGLIARSAASADSLPASFPEAAASERVERGLELTDPVPPGCRTLVNLTNHPLEIADRDGTIVIAPLGSRRLEKARAERLELGPLIDAGFLSVVRDVSARSESPRPGSMAWFRELTLWSQETLNLVFVLLVVVALPGAIFFFGSDVPHLLHVARYGPNQDTARAILIGLGLQWIFIAVASVTPGLLYFLFDREKLGTLRERFTRQIFRLDPSVRTLADVNAKYGKLLDEAYGRERGTERLLPGRRFPIVLATTVITLGWIVTMLNSNLTATVARAPSLADLFTPVPRAVPYAFLGAYFFTLQYLLRGFMRGDLRPKSYAHVAVRVLGSAVLAFVLSKVVAYAHGGTTHDQASLLVLAFVAGVLPETTLLRIQELTGGFVRKKSSQLPSLYEAHPLTHLEGIDIYDRARLTDEGVTNVEALAHHDLVDLVLKTRIPVPPLVDWVDQAILYLHVGGGAVDDEETPKESLERLRCFGIRTATDLEEAHRRAKLAGREEEFFAILPGPAGAADGTPRLQMILDAIRDQEWMDNLRHWHTAASRPPTIRYPNDFETGIPALA